MNPVKRTAASLLLLVLISAAILVTALPQFASAQTSSYTIDSVYHQIQVMPSGNVAIVDTIQVSGSVADGFVIGFPYQYSADILKVTAYDDSQIYDMNFGVQLGNHTGLYGAEVNFRGNSPSTFTVAFILSNNLVTQEEDGSFSVNFPAYPSLAYRAATCNVAVSFPNPPNTLTVTKDDGNVGDENYATTNLPPYTYAPATAYVTLPAGSMQLVTINDLNVQVTIGPTGQVTATETYQLTNNATTPLASLMLNLPPQATELSVKDDSGIILEASPTVEGDLLIVNTTLAAPLNPGQSTTLTVNYKLPGATLQGSDYVLADFQLFPAFRYLVEHATMRFNLPEGATIITPQASQLDSSSTLTRDTYQDALTVTKNSVSYVDYLSPQQNTLQLTYDYNPVWVSFRPTFWAAFMAAIACVGAVIFQQLRPQTKFGQRTEWLPPQKPQVKLEKQEVIRTGQPVSAEYTRQFIDSYEDKKQLTAELRSLDSRAQRGKIPRRQYKAQRAAIEIRLEAINKTLDQAKAVFRGQSGGYPDLIKQLDLAEADLSQADEIIRTLEMQQSKGEISHETYKRVNSDYLKVRDRAESAINGILLRLREKIR